MSFSIIDVIKTEGVIIVDHFGGKIRSIARYSFVDIFLITKSNMD